MANRWELKLGERVLSLARGDLVVVAGNYNTFSGKVKCFFFLFIERGFVFEIDTFQTDFFVEFEHK